MKNLKPEIPFFARYLEGQDFPQVKSNVKAGPVVIPTRKFPSDGDEDVTMKAPSDDDEVGPTS